MSGTLSVFVSDQGEPEVQRATNPQHFLETLVTSKQTVQVFKYESILVRNKEIVLLSDNNFHTFLLILWVPYSNNFLAVASLTNYPTTLKTGVEALALMWAHTAQHQITPILQWVKDRLSDTSTPVYAMLLCGRTERTNGSASTATVVNFLQDHLQVCAERFDLTVRPVSCPAFQYRHDHPWQHVSIYTRQVRDDTDREALEIGIHVLPLELKPPQEKLTDNLMFYETKVGCHPSVFCSRGYSPEILAVIGKEEPQPTHRFPKWAFCHMLLEQGDPAVQAESLRRDREVFAKNLDAFWKQDRVDSGTEGTPLA